MKKLVVLIIFCSLIVQVVFAKKTETPVQSTQCIETFDGAKVEQSQLSKQEKNEQKETQNRSKEYIKMKNKIDKQDLRRVKKEKEIEYLEYRLELKKQKLEEFSSDTSKGE